MKAGQADYVRQLVEAYPQQAYFRDKYDGQTAAQSNSCQPHAGAALTLSHAYGADIPFEGLGSAYGEDPRYKLCPAHIAAIEGHEDVLRRILAPSNNPVTCMLSCLLQGRTPLDRARQYDQQEAVEVLLAHQGKAS